jgi:hydrogenase-4 membrane subunit HyfE
MIPGLRHERGPPDTGHSAPAGADRRAGRAGRDLLAAAALFMVILHETGRIPVETHTGTNEFGMIEEARAFEHSGPYFALLKWGSELKQLILFTILADVFLAPWGLASTQRPDAVVLAIVALLAKACAVGCVVAVIDNSFAKLRLFKITEFVSGAFLLAVLGVFTLYLGVADGPGPGAWRLPGRGQRDRRRDAADRVRHAAPGAGPGPDPAVHGAVRADLGAGHRHRRGPEPAGLVRAGRAVRRAQGGGGAAAAPALARPAHRKRAPDEEEQGGVAGSQTLSPASAVLAGIVLAAVGFFCFGAMKIQGVAGGPGGKSTAPATALAIAGAMVLVAFGLMIVRRDVASQAIGFFSLENAISLAALVVASGLPLILETAFLFDLLVAVVVFGMLIRAHHTKAESQSTADLTRLRG